MPAATRGLEDVIEPSRLPLHRVRFQHLLPSPVLVTFSVAAIEPQAQETTGELIWAEGSRGVIVHCCREVWQPEQEAESSHPQLQAMQQREQTGNDTKSLISKYTVLVGLSVDVTNCWDQKHPGKERVNSTYTSVPLFIISATGTHVGQEPGGRS